MGKNDNFNNAAPVYVPTLCRYEHFKKAIESLKANTLPLNSMVKTTR